MKKRFLTLSVIGILMLSGCSDKSKIITDEVDTKSVVSEITYSDVEIVPTVDIEELKKELKKSKDEQMEKKKGSESNKKNEEEEISTVEQTVSEINQETDGIQYESVETPCSDYEECESVEYGNYSEDICMTSIGVYTVTFYSPDEAGSIGCWGNTLTPGYSCAMPIGSGLQGCMLYIEGFGYRYCEDESPQGICDLYVGSIGEIPSYGMTTAEVYIVG